GSPAALSFSEASVGRYRGLLAPVPFRGLACGLPDPMLCAAVGSDVAARSFGRFLPELGPRGTFPRGPFFGLPGPGDSQKISIQLSLSAWSTRAIEAGRPSAAREVTPASAMPQGTMPEKCERSGFTFKAIP